MLQHTIDPCQAIQLLLPLLRLPFECICPQQRGRDSWHVPKHTPAAVAAK
jgi:hypothetical protein